MTLSEPDPLADLEADDDLGVGDLGDLDEDLEVLGDHRCVFLALVGEGQRFNARE